MATERDFEYKGRKVKIRIARSAKGGYVGFPIINPPTRALPTLGNGAATPDEALDEAERLAKEAIDSE